MELGCVHRTEGDQGGLEVEVLARMLKIVSLNSREAIEIAILNRGAPDLSADSKISTICSLTRGGWDLSVEALYSRKRLRIFRDELLAMHRELSIGQAASIWSAQGNVAISIVLAERGSVAFRCVLSGPRIDKGLFAQGLIDQTYLPEIARQVDELSNAPDCGGD